MGEPRFVIMAGGKGLRWTIESKTSTVAINKLDVLIDGQPLLARTLAMLEQLGAPGPELCGAPESLRTGRHAVSEPSVEGLCGALSGWMADRNDAVVILLGDVAWSHDSLSRVCCERPEDIRFYGKLGANRFTGKPWGEIYALSAPSRALEHFSASLRNCACADPAARLWDLYGAVSGTTPLSRDPHPLWPQTPWFSEIEDWTDDIDRPVDYRNLLRALEGERPTA